MALGRNKDGKNTDGKAKDDDRAVDRMRRPRRRRGRGDRRRRGRPVRHRGLRRPGSGGPGPVGPGLGADPDAGRRAAAGGAQPRRGTRGDLGADSQRPASPSPGTPPPRAPACGARWPPNWPNHCATTAPRSASRPDRGAAKWSSSAAGVVRFIGVEGYRWMIRCGRAWGVDALAVEARAALAATVVRGDRRSPGTHPAAGTAARTDGQSAAGRR